MTMVRNDDGRAGGPTVLSVSRLTALLRDLVEENFLAVAVEGEISNFTAAASGHYYFALKDANAQMRAVMFKPHNRLLNFLPENGMQVLCAGRVSLYTQRGEVQLLVERLEPVGVGGLQLAFEQLKARLAEEGLFAVARKRPLPPFPTTIGVVTSGSGAAVHDILQILGRRGSGLRVLLSPVRVQGEGAAEEIARAIVAQNRLGAAEVLIVGRGGGSLEDLWAFNEEVVARAIHASKIPVISAVGHEVDFTISDFVADLRAPTPSAAAELVVRNRLELEGHVDQLTLRLAGLLRGRLATVAARLDGLAQRLRAPGRDLPVLRRQVAELTGRLLRSRQQGDELRCQHLRGLIARLDGLSPLAILGRGYAIVTREADHATITDAARLTPGERLAVRLAQGALRARVEEIHE